MKKKMYMLLLLSSLCFISACGNKETPDTAGSVSDDFRTEETLEQPRNTSPTEEASEQPRDTSPAEEASEQSRDTSPTEENGTDADPVAELQGGLDQISELVAADVENTVAGLRAEYEALTADVDTYEKYLDNTDKIQAFYTRAYEDTKALCSRLREFCVRYAEEIMAGDQPYDEKYDDFDEILDNVYDDAGDDILDDIYDGILEDMLDYYYDGILDDASDTVAFDDWYDARSDEFDRWYDARSDIYDECYDFRLDVYDFWLDLKSEMWDNDTGRAEKKIADFREDIEK